MLLYIPSFDRALSSPSNLICYVMEQVHGKFRLGSMAGVLDRCYSGGFFLTNLVTTFKIEDIPTRDPNLKTNSRNKDSNKYITINKVVYICLSVREAVATVSVGVGQGYVKCMCTGKCQTNRCSCKAADIPCNTKCHPHSASGCVNSFTEPSSSNESNE